MKTVRYSIGIATAVFSLVCSLPVAAENWTFSSPARNFYTLYPDTTGFAFYIDGAVINPNNPCSNVGANRFWLDRTLPNYHAMVSMLLTADANNRTVQVLYDADSTACNGPVQALWIPG